MWLGFLANAPYLSKYGAVHLTVSTMITGTALMVALSLPWLTIQNFRGIPPIAWLGLTYSPPQSIRYLYFVWAYALKRIRVSHTSVFNNFTPVAGVLLVLTAIFMVRTKPRLETNLNG